MTRVDSPIHITPIKDNYSKISYQIKNKLRIDEKYETLECKMSFVKAKKKENYFQLKKFEDHHFSHSNQDHSLNPYTYSKLEFKSALNKCLDCDICEASEDIVAKFLKKNKNGEKPNNIDKLLLLDEENHVDVRKINFENFKNRRNKYKSIINMRNSQKLPEIYSPYSPNFDKIKKRIPSVIFNPVHERSFQSLQKTSRNSSAKDKFNIMDVSLTSSIDKVMITKSSNDIKNSRLNGKFSSGKNSLPEINRVEKIIEKMKEKTEEEKMKDEVELEKNSKKFSDFIDREYQNFLNQLYTNSQKYYNMVLKGTLAKQKYKEAEMKREMKNQALKNNNLKLVKI